MASEFTEVSKAEIRRFVVQNFLFGEDDDFGNDDSFVERGIMDSTGVLELVAFLESRYQIELDDTELAPENLDSINRIARFLKQRA